MRRGKNKVTIKIPRELYKRLKVLIGGTGFSSVTEFIVYVMRDLAGGGKLKVEDDLSPKEVDLIRNRLRSLGYLE